MASVFPTTLDGFTPNVDGVDIYTAADMNDVQNAIAAIQAAMGTGAAASADAVANALMRRDVNGITYFNDYWASVKNTVGQAIPYGLTGWTVLNWSTVRQQNGAVWMSSFPSVLFCLKSGLVTIDAQISYPAAAGGERNIAFDINGSIFIRAATYQATSNVMHCPAHRTLPVHAGDYIRVLTQQNCTAATSLTLSVQDYLSPEVTLHYE